VYCLVKKVTIFYSIYSINNDVGS